jgi:ABC-type dipeptide/oligopeptide/nickel transport system permease component
MEQMKVEFHQIKRMSANLLGLSIASISLGFSFAYSPSIPELLKQRMPAFLSFVTFGAFLFLFSCCSAFFATAFLDNNTHAKAKSGLGVVALFSLWFGLLSIAVALLVLVFFGSRIFIAPFVPPPQ